MKPGNHITVEVCYPFRFETLSLDPGSAQALQGSDQGAALVPSAVTNAKGLSTATDVVFKLNSYKMSARVFDAVPKNSDTKEIEDGLSALGTLLDDKSTAARLQIKSFIDQTKVIYAQLQEVESQMPRPVKSADDKIERGSGVKDWTPNPWDDDCYAKWRGVLIYELHGNRDVYDAFEKDVLAGKKNEEACPGDALQEPGVPVDILATAAGLIAGLPTQGKPSEDGSMLPVNPSENPVFDNSAFDGQAKTLQDKINKLEDKAAKKTLQSSLDKLIRSEKGILDLLVGVSANFSKVNTDLQTFFVNIAVATGDDVPSPFLLGRIADPRSHDPSLAAYKMLGRQITYTINAVNQIATPVLSVATSQQKQAVASITALYADPRFEVSSGAFVSTLPNRSFANYTDVTMKGTPPEPAPLDIKISESISRPELLPFVAANWRIGREYNFMPDKRRSAFYGTVAVALNPYNTLPEFAGGVSFSWRAFLFSPLYHLGHGVHLTQGETVGQIWCTYVTNPSTGSSACSPITTPPAPSTKTYWTGAFAFGISVRVPTTFSSASSGSGGGSGGSTK
jgi:hypothetical protein